MMIFGNENIRTFRIDVIQNRRLLHPHNSRNVTQLLKNRFQFAWKIIDKQFKAVLFYAREHIMKYRSYITLKFGYSFK